MSRKLELKLNELEERIGKLENDGEIFCAGASMEKVKIYKVIYRLLNVLGYELMGEEVTLRKKHK